MRLSRAGLITLMLAFSGHTQSKASSITVTAQGFDGREAISATNILPDDLSQGYSFRILDTTFSSQLRHDILEPGYTGTFIEGSLSEYVDSAFQIRLSFSQTGSTTPLEEQPYILLKGHASGYFSAARGIENVSGGMFGLGTMAEFSRGIGDSTLAGGIFDEILKASSFQITAAVSGGHSNQYGVNLSASIPHPSTPVPTPAPEPSVLLMIATALAGMVVVRRLEIRRSKVLYEPGDAGKSFQATRSAPMASPRPA